MLGPMKHDLAAQMHKVSELVPWSRNPRRNDAAAERLAYTIAEHGWTTPLLVQASTMRIIGGHTRLKAAIKIGLVEVPCVLLDVDDRQADSIAIADNRLGELAEWDADGLADLLRELDDAGADVLAMGYTDADMAELMASLVLPPPADQPDDVGAESQPEVPVSKRGEVYELGPHRLVCGDCRDAETVARLLGGRSINVAFTSPPYASQRKYDESSGFKPIPPDEYVEWFDAVQSNVREHLAADGSWFVNIKEHCDDGQRSLYVKDLTIAHVRAWGWQFVDELIWVHGGTPVEAHRRFKNGWEPVFQFTANYEFKFNPEAVRHESASVPGAYSGAGRGRIDTAKSQGVTGDIFANDEKVAGLAYPSNAIKLGKNTTALGHGAAFPTGLPDFFIKAYSDPGDAIFDPFLGSGTTLIAAAQNKRTAFGCEISEGYCDVIRRRWTAWARKAGVDAGSGALEPSADV